MMNLTRFFITSDDTGKKIDRIILSRYPNSSKNLIFKAFRKRDIKIDGARVDAAFIPNTGSLVEIYTSEPIDKPAKKVENKWYEVVYEDENIVLVNKKQGISVQSENNNISENEDIPLIDLIMNEKKECLYLCHRIDRNTSGLLLLAKSTGVLDAAIKEMTLGNIKKYYQCIVSGHLEKDQDELIAYLFKDSIKSRVYINNQPSKNSKKIITKYRTLAVSINTSLLEIELVTGRTHQIRAHLAYTGHPVIGDGKYGRNDLNKEFNIYRQELCAYKMSFCNIECKDLSYLSTSVFKIDPVFAFKTDWTYL